jgi:hypothetical protein
MDLSSAHQIELLKGLLTVSADLAQVACNVLWKEAMVKHSELAVSYVFIVREILNQTFLCSSVIFTTK